MRFMKGDYFEEFMCNVFQLFYTFNVFHIILCVFPLSLVAISEELQFHCTRVKEMTFNWQHVSKHLTGGV